MSLPFIDRIVEERIREAQEAGLFDDLPGKGRPLVLDDDRWVPEDLRVAYRILKNAGVLPPEAEIRREIRRLEDLLRYVADGEERRAVLQDLGCLRVRLELLQRRSFDLARARLYGRKLVRRLVLGKRGP